MAKGFDEFSTDNNEFNLWNFIIKGVLAKINTAFLIKVINVYPEKNFVDVLPLIKGVDGDGNSIDTTPLFRLPYFQYRGGKNQITITPAVNDVGLAIASDRDISNYKLFRQETKPNTLRMFDARDSLYIGGFLNEAPIENYIEINDKGVQVTTTGDIIQQAKGEIEEIAGSDITIISQKDGKQSSMVISPEQIKLQSNGQSLTINENGLQIDVGNVNLEADNLTLNVKRNLDVNVSQNITVTAGDNIATKATTGVTIQAPTVRFSGLVPFRLIFVVDGFQYINGNMTAMGLAIPAPALRENSTPTGNEVATAGTLTTNTLTEWDTFISYYTSYEKTEMKFKIGIATEELTVTIPLEQLQLAGSYQNLAPLIEEHLNNLATVEIQEQFIPNNYQMRFTTTGTGDIDGYISYLEDITENINATPGTLTTGDLGNWENFLQSLNSQNLAFRIIAGGQNYIYQLSYAEIGARTSFTQLADYISSLNSKITVTTIPLTETNNALVFETLDKGSARGRISYLKKTDTPDTPAVLISGILESWDDFREELGNEDLAIECTINGENTIFYLTNAEIKSMENYSELLQSLFSSSRDVTVGYSSNNKINITTRNSGENATLSYFTTVDSIEATNTFLETGVLMEFSAIKEAYASGENDITFYITADGEKNDYIITPSELSSFDNYEDLVEYLNNSSDNITVTLASTQQLIFTLKDSGKKNISYLQYEAPTEEGIETIDGSVLFSGTEAMARITMGTDEITNIYSESATLLKLTEESGASLTNGKTLSFAINSIELLKGTADTGASLTQGRDGNIVVLNNSATLLNGTASTGAIRMSGSDDGIPDVYDGVIKIIGNLSVTEQVESEALVVNKDTDLTGAITLNPYEIIEEEVYKKSDVIVNGGIIAENLTVTETGTIDQLIVNNGVEINGDVTLNSSAITGNGNRMTFDSDGVRNNKMFISSDYEAE